MSFRIVENYAAEFKRFGEKRNGVFDSIEIHSIGTAQDDPEKVREAMNQYNPGGIVHAIVASNQIDFALEILPWDNVCWADAGYANQHSYAIEICESKQMRYKANSAEYVILDKERFLADIRRGYENAVKYTAIKCEQFGFEPMKKLANGLYQVYSHQEAYEKGLGSAHVDPTHIWPAIGKSMEIFRAEVKAVMDGDTEIDPVPVPTPEENRYIVQAGAYARKENAEQQAEQLRKSGFEAIVKTLF